MGDLNDSQYHDQLRDIVERAIQLGAGTLREVCALCQGANPANVEKVLRGLGYLESPSTLQKLSTQSKIRAAKARAKAANYLSAIPAANPEHSQWWFTLSGIESLACQIYQRTASSRLLFLGASTLTPYYTERFNFPDKPINKSAVLDIDQELINAASKQLPNVDVILYDVADDLPSSVKNAPFPAVVMDPPWYAEAYEAFFLRASEACEHNGVVISTLPGVMTRPNELMRREEVLESAKKAGLEFFELVTGLAEYGIPDFEQRVLRSSSTLDDRPWRYGDVIFLRKKKTSEVNVPPLKKQSMPQSFYRKPNEFRFFFNSERCNSTLGAAIVRADSYSATISQREVDGSSIALWTSTKEGFQVRDGRVLTEILQAWASTQRIEKLKDEITTPWSDTHQLILDCLTSNGLLGDDPNAIRRTDDEIRQINKSRLSDWATSESLNETRASDGYRTTYARDRDRIVWSTSLRRLANKTQVFSTSESDHVRHRLAHSIEVMQLASTVGESIGLDRDLIEAGALAHDVGHTPFGHAGETAIDATMRAFAPRSGGFNHYEHGLDVVVWLETAYRHPGLGGLNGLNLSNEVLECIFKHTFCYSGAAMGQVELTGISKHSKRIPLGPCHLEGQAVRSADKISYLISDIEDGLALGAVTLDDLRACRLFKHAPIDLKAYDTDSPLDVFLSQRRNLIRLLMEDLIDEASRRLLKLRHRDDVRNRSSYTIDHSDEIRCDLDEVWNRVQGGKLHKDRRVISANRRAAEIVHQLVVLFAFCPEMVDPDFRRRHRELIDTPYMQWYLAPERSNGFPREKLSRDFLFLDYMIMPTKIEDLRIENLILSKDYVASMTDRAALEVHMQSFGRSR